jgi:hypothetical protein
MIRGGEGTERRVSVPSEATLRSRDGGDGDKCVHSGHSGPSELNQRHDEPVRLVGETPTARFFSIAFLCVLPR